MLLLHYMVWIFGLNVLWNKDVEKKIGDENKVEEEEEVCEWVSDEIECGRKKDIRRNIIYDVGTVVT